MQEPIKIPWCHSFQNWLISPNHAFSCSHAYNMYIIINFHKNKIKAYLSIKCTCIMLISLFILFYNNKIRSRPISRCRITPLLTQVVCWMMVDIMIRINNKSSCFPPYTMSRPISNSSMKYNTCFVNANICRLGLFYWEYLSQKCQYICWWLRFGKLCPCNNHTTWSIYSFHTIEPWSSKVILSLSFCARFIMWLYICSFQGRFSFGYHNTLQMPVNVCQLYFWRCFFHSAWCPRHAWVWTTFWLVHPWTLHLAPYSNSCNAQKTPPQ